jgi:6-phosphofructokinase
MGAGAPNNQWARLLASVSRAKPQRFGRRTGKTQRRISMSQQKILVAQGGGPTAVINQSLVGVALEARKFSGVSHVYGAAFGVRGIVNEDFVDLSSETSRNLEAVANTPSSALGSTRDKPDLAYCQEILKVLKAHGIGNFFYIGGNDSSDTVRIVAGEARKSGHPLRCIHIPKTIDNDLVGFDHTPGYPSAARFVAQAFMGVNLDNSALRGVYCAVIMGRHAGFLTAAAAMAKKFPDDGPHLLYLPERVFSTDKFLADVKATFERHGRCIIAVSEGVHDDRGAPIITKLASSVEKDAHGNIQLSGTGALADLLCEEIKTKLGIKRVRGDTFGYLQRSFAGCVSDVDQGEAREVGEKAVQYALRGDSDGSVAIRRVGDYAVNYPLIPLETVAGKTRVMEDELINATGNGVTEAFLSYLRPLLGSGLPEVERLRGTKVAKILK